MELMLLARKETLELNSFIAPLEIPVRPGRMPSLKEGHFLAFGVDFGLGEYVALVPEFGQLLEVFDAASSGKVDTIHWYDVFPVSKPGGKTDMANFLSAVVDAARFGKVAAGRPAGPKVEETHPDRVIVLVDLQQTRTVRKGNMICVFSSEDSATDFVAKERHPEFYSMPMIWDDFVKKYAVDYPYAIIDPHKQEKRIVFVK